MMSQSVHASARAMFGGASDPSRFVISYAVTCSKGIPSHVRLRRESAPGLNVRDKRTLTYVSSRLETEVRASCCLFPPPSSLSFVCNTHKSIFHFYKKYRMTLLFKLSGQKR